MAALIGDAAILVEFGGALVIALYVVLAVLGLLRGTLSIDRARLLVANGVLAALDLKLAATLLKTIELQSWGDIGIAFAILGIRTVVKRALTSEEEKIAAREKLSARR